ncbi:segregation/condensation protein A [Candidatus Woesearchaeota archaeon]|nr:segregation/condensation protein A [Candidatus Woesearchaeota archaeon]
MQDKIYEMIVHEDELTWQTIIYDLVKSEEMDPWDVDVSLLTKKYIETLKALKAMDFRLTGKVVLASSILLKIKSNRLLGADLQNFEKLLHSGDEQFFDEEDSGFLSDDVDSEDFKYEPTVLIPRTPQPRKRKVSVYDLVDALQKALEVHKRRTFRDIIKPKTIEVPKKKVDITKLIGDLYSQITGYFKTKNANLTFSMLIPSESKEDKIYTFVPLLHLSNQQKVDLHQLEHFGDINIKLSKNGSVDDLELEEKSVEAKA